MNYIQIIGAIIIIFGTIVVNYGAHLKGVNDAKFQHNVEGYITEQKKLDTPSLVGLKIIGKNPDYELLVRNIGNKTASNIKLIFKENSVPNAFSANAISGAEEIPKGVEYSLPLNLFSGINLLLKMPNSDEKYIKELRDYLNKFNSGSMGFMPRFYLEYYDGDKKMESDTYLLVIDKNHGISYFGKEQ